MPLGLYPCYIFVYTAALMVLLVGSHVGVTPLLNEATPVTLPLAIGHNDKCRCIIFYTVDLAVE